jgi:hypothetical protein
MVSRPAVWKAAQLVTLERRHPDAVDDDGEVSPGRHDLHDAVLRLRRETAHAPDRAGVGRPGRSGGSNGDGEQEPECPEHGPTRTATHERTESPMRARTAPASPRERATQARAPYTDGMRTMIALGIAAVLGTPALVRAQSLTEVTAATGIAGTAAGTGVRSAAPVMQQVRTAVANQSAAAGKIGGGWENGGDWGGNGRGKASSRGGSAWAKAGNWKSKR